MIWEAYQVFNNSCGNNQNSEDFSLVQPPMLTLSRHWAGNGASSVKSWEDGIPSNVEGRHSLISNVAKIFMCCLNSQKLKLTAGSLHLLIHKKFHMARILSVWIKKKTNLNSEEILGRFLPRSIIEA